VFGDPMDVVFGDPMVVVFGDPMVEDQFFLSARRNLRRTLCLDCQQTGGL